MRFILPALAELVGWSLLVNDIKGDLYQQTWKHRQDSGNLVLRFDPFGDDSHGFNPILTLETGDLFPDDAMEIAEAIVRVQGNEPHWSQAAQELVAGLIMYVRLIMPESGSLVDVRKMLGLDTKNWQRLIRGGKNTDPRQLELWEMTPEEERDKNYEPPFEHNGKLYPGVLAVAEQFKWPELETKLARYGNITPANREMLSVISTALTQTRWLDSIPIAADISKNKFDFSVARERPVTLYLILPPRRLASHSAWLRLIVTCFLQKVMVKAEHGKVPVMLVMDEFAALAGGIGRDDHGDGFPVVSRNMPLFRQYGIKLLSAWQSVAQCKNIFGEGFEDFLANAGVVITFAPQDVTTSEHFSKLSGQAVADVIGGSRSISSTPGQVQGASVTDNVSLGVIPLPVLLPQDLRNMDQGFAIIFSHKAKGAVPFYLPWPGDLPQFVHLIGDRHARDELDRER